MDWCLVNVNLGRWRGASLLNVPLLELAPNPIPMPIPITTSTIPVIISAWTVLENAFQHSQQPIFSQLLNLQEKCWRFLKHIKWLSWNNYIQFWGFKYSNITSSPNVSTTPIMAMGCRQCLPLSVVQLKGKHCRKPHCRNGVVDTFGHRCPWANIFVTFVGA